MADPFVITSTVTGLQEFDFVVPTTDAYTVQGTLQVPKNLVPTASQGAGGGGIGLLLVLELVPELFGPPLPFPV